MVRSFDGFLIVFHALQLLCVIFVDVMTSSHLFFSSIILSISLFPDSMVPCQSSVLNICSFMLHIDFFISQLDREHILFDILLVCIF